MSRILIWSPNYAPELTGIPPLVTDASEWLAARGHEVDVVAPVPNYPERKIHNDYRGRIWMSEQRNGVRVHRSWLRVRPEESFIDKALYEITASTVPLPRVLSRLGRTDVVVCVVPTLLAGAYASLLAGRSRVVLWMQDLVVSAASSVDGIGFGARRALAAAGAIERLAARRADRIVVCSPGFRDYLVERGVDPASIDVVYNWVDLTRITQQPVPVDSSPTRFLYAGNLGYTQGLETLIDAARIGGDGVSVEIVGAGNAEREVRRLAAHTENVVVRSPVANADFPGLLASHHVHLVIQRRVSAGANLPSKIGTYLASGRPVVASIDPGTPAAELLRESGGAVLVEPEDPAKLARAMVRLGSKEGVRRELGSRARAFAETTLGKEETLCRLEQSILG